MKKGDLSIQTIIVAILGLLVLIVLAFIFRDQITKAASNYFSIGKDATDSAQGNKCVSILTAGNHKCADKCDGEWHELNTATKWTDCKERKCCEK